jgi:pyruvate formate lyase activating enzyme
MGMIFNIQEFSVNDGAGIRTTVFLKGCPLACRWCSNPEGQSFSPDLFHNKTLCRKCLECFKSCPVYAVSKDENGFPVFKRELCSKCTTYDCIDNCSEQGIKILGEEISAKKLLDEVLTNQLFFRNSGGGVTLSGGEPLSQFEFVKEFLELCNKNGISVGVETCGHFSWDNVKNFISNFDFIYYDLKCLNPDLHKKFTESDNSIILGNLEKLTLLVKEKITISIPVVPGFNDTNEFFDEVISYCNKLELSNVRIIPYHNLGESKYSAIGLNYKMSEHTNINNEHLMKIKQKFEDKNIHCLIE